jgi:hypothetical protein
MATKKQRRRREKGRRHEYEFVYVDQSGEEVEVDEPEPRPKKDPAERRSASAKPAGKGDSAADRIKPPSWERTLRRALMFAPFILIFFYITAKDKSSYSTYLAAIPVLLLMAPFMYLVDSMAYRSYQKRVEKRAGQPKKSK